MSTSILGIIFLSGFIAGAVVQYFRIRTLRIKIQGKDMIIKSLQEHYDKP